MDCMETEGSRVSSSTRTATPGRDGSVGQDSTRSRRELIVARTGAERRRNFDVILRRYIAPEGPWHQPIPPPSRPLKTRKSSHFHVCYRKCFRLKWLKEP